MGPTFPALAGILQIVGFTQCGILLASTMLKERQIHASFVAGWETGAAASLHPVVECLHASGLLLLVVAQAASCQLAHVASSKRTSKSDEYVSSKLIGFGFHAKQIVSDLLPDSMHSAVVRLTIISCLGKTLPMLKCQISIAVAEASSLSGTSVARASILLSSAMTILQVHELITAAYRNKTNVQQSAFRCFIPVVLIVMVPFGALYMITDTIMIGICATHRWGLGSGCA